ncbi:MAG TPA: DNA-binding response regulator [Anaerolineaceae bacterium]|nr:MAG: DNA-binding response regulator [Chloroflexi bacterium GWB2_54_36]HAL15945.1 DNA-binding response regulator [Anaerolineaceae bacterium]HBA90353.1 DNA-binding response regulator [Anaerolineaceae bacterium]
MDKDPTILLIDDEPQILRALKTILAANHFKVALAATGEQGIAMAVAQPPDLIILDLTLPDMDGIAVAEAVREWSRVPIIVLSVRDNEKDKVAALDKGADDYLTKPFGIEELLARIRVALRHSEQAIGNKQSIIKAGPVTVDLARHVATMRGEEIRLTATEFKLLAYLTAHADRVLTHQAILTQVWGFEDFDHVEYLRVYVGQLRKKLEQNPDDPQLILTEPGVGYRFKAGE